LGNKTKGKKLLKLKWGQKVKGSIKSRREAKSQKVWTREVDRSNFSCCI